MLFSAYGNKVFNFLFIFPTSVGSLDVSSRFAERVAATELRVVVRFARVLLGTCAVDYDSGPDSMARLLLLLLVLSHLQGFGMTCIHGVATSCAVVHVHVDVPLPCCRR